MHVAMWSPAWPLEKHLNGIVTYVHWTKRELERLGHRVSVFTGVIDSEVDDPTVHLVRREGWQQLGHRISRRLPVQNDFFSWGSAIGASMLELHRHDPIDIIEMEESFGWSAEVGKVTSIPVLVKLHGPAFLSLVEHELTTPAGRQRIEDEGRGLARASAIASPCAVTLAQTLERYGLSPAIAQHIVNPLTMENVSQRWSLDACDPDTILFVGRFDKRKGGDLVLQAFELLLRTHPQAKLIFVGPDVGLLESDGSLTRFEQFRDLTFSPELRHRIEFRGRMANRDIAQLRLRAMVTVLASRWENQGYAALEAMFLGCPVVCSDAGGCPEIISDGRTGLLARSEDVAHFAAQLTRMLDDRDAAAAMGSAARAYVSEFHSAARVAAESLDLYKRVIAHSARRAA
jgi:glycosyltransferase involved in cell wall biosynthesis